MILINLAPPTPYTPDWRYKLDALRLMGRLAQLRAADRARAEATKTTNTTNTTDTSAPPNTPDVPHIRTEVIRRRKRPDSCTSSTPLPLPPTTRAAPTTPTAPIIIWLSFFSTLWLSIFSHYFNHLNSYNLVENLFSRPSAFSS